MTGISFRADSDDDALDFDLLSVQFCFHGFSGWRHDGDEVPRFALTFTCFCRRCAHSWHWRTSRLTPRHAEHAVAEHGCSASARMLGETQDDALARVQAAMFDERRAAEGRAKERDRQEIQEHIDSILRLERNLAEFGPIDDLPKLVRDETIKLYMRKEPDEIAAIRARLRAQRERAAR